MQVGAVFSLDRRESLWKDCVLAFPIALIPSILLYTSATAVLRAFGADLSQMQAPQRSVTVVDALGSVLFAPPIETLLLAVLVSSLLTFIRRAVLVALVSAFVFGLLHGMSGLLWFFGTAWSFFVFSCAYLAWRERGFARAFTAAAVPHALVNLFVFVVLALSKGR